MDCIYVDFFVRFLLFCSACSLLSYSTHSHTPGIWESAQEHFDIMDEGRQGLKQQTFSWHMLQWSSDRTGSAWKQVTFRNLASEKKKGGKKGFIWERDCAAASARLMGRSKWGVKTGLGRQRHQESSDRRKSSSPSSISTFAPPHSSLRLNYSLSVASSFDFFLSFTPLPSDMVVLQVPQEEKTAVLS